MPRNQRIGLIVAAVAVAVLAFVIASPGGDDDGDKATQAAPAAQTDTGTGTDTATETQAEAPAPPKPEVARIRIRGGEVVGGPPEIKVEKGDTVVIVVSADAPDDIHLHGYDIEKKVAPGQPARFRFKANFEGEFEIESHVAEDAGREPLVGTLIVEPR
jgi:FtsP/CotA-like multicopper oxidase with cupredoxin domain